MAMFFEMVASE